MSTTNSIVHVNSVANRLSLRKPQRTSLEILARLCEILRLEKDQDVADALRAVKSEYPTVSEFEREFPSLCFALATGVGKTRLMGAFIAYLHRAEGIQNFFVLAPNLTIYTKLIQDFTSNTPKYVFQGIAEFATTPPEIITGDNYEGGRGVREGVSAKGLQRRLFASGSDGPVHVNIFNISKINSEVRGGKEARIKRLSEYIGESYFSYLSQLDDLVLIMDESHRYRAEAGMRAINELKPILGLELTATPFIEKRERQDFKNVVYSYRLANALDDGFVKTPTIVTRLNFDPRAYGEDDPNLERIKLEDGIHCHEETKVQLDLYARNSGAKLVKPFMLVVARTTEHAEALRRLIEGAEFFDGRYKDKVITVHSNQSGAEKDETVAQLLSVESPDNPTEIVVHVNMLKEGWDVTNLYTIVPLRTANSKTLVEQSIGRGLRLPYGKRTGVAAVDRLCIVAHDKFKEIVDLANDPTWVIRDKLVVGQDIGTERVVVQVSQPTFVDRAVARTTAALGPATKLEPAHVRSIVDATREAIREMERLPSSKDLTLPEVQTKIVERVQQIMTPMAGVLPFYEEIRIVEQVVHDVIEAQVEMTIDIPRITITPKGDVRGGFRAFQLDLRNVRFQPVEDDIVVYDLHSNQQALLKGKAVASSEERAEDFVVFGLVDYDDVSYDEHSKLLYGLAEQVVMHLRSYLANEEQVRNVLRNQQNRLAEIVHTQMQAHYEEAATEYEVSVSKGFLSMRDNPYTSIENEPAHDFRRSVPDLSRIRQMVFEGFRRCSHLKQKFESDPERRFAVVVENPTDASVLKWMRPYKGLLHMFLKDDSEYVPDFIVETFEEKWICEVKARSEMADPVVLEKARVAATWCKHASLHAKEHGSKPWRYCLIPDDAIFEHMTFSNLSGSHVF